MNKINNKLPWGLAIGTLGVTIAGAFNGTAILGLTIDESVNIQKY
jgi:hypothetical protein